MKLPNGDRCDIGTKLEDYCLNPLHREGRHKARVFESALRITLANASELKTAIQSAAATSEYAFSRGHNGFGQQYNLRFKVVTDSGSAEVLTGWIVLDGEDFPRLTTCYIV
jgi:hypothetical protein